MKILLAQAEIAQIVQQALVSYISERLVISDGTEIQVTMTDDGATIDLITGGEPRPQTPAKKAPAKAETVKAETNVKSFNRSPKAAPAPAVAETVAETEDETVPFLTDIEDVKAEAAVEPEAEAVEEEAAEVAAPPVRSLFANLRKPVN